MAIGARLVCGFAVLAVALVGTLNVSGGAAPTSRKGVPRGPWSGMGFNVLEQGGQPFEGLLLRTDLALKINHVWLEHYVDPGAQQQNRYTPTTPVNRVWFDDVVVSTAYVRPIQRQERRRA